MNLLKTKASALAGWRLAASQSLPKLGLRGSGKRKASGPPRSGSSASHSLSSGVSSWVSKS